MSDSPNTISRCGVVAIGRNEGDRLRVCLESVVSTASAVVYVDSGSTDGSVAMARGHGVEVVELDMSVPFTAARARNAGARRLREIAPQVQYVQFVDGDCEVVRNWLADAVGFLDERGDVAAVCGRRRERYPERSIYNRLCDLEWSSGATGETRACGGDVMMRASAFEAAGGYRVDVIAGEEPELCVRLRAAGWKIWRLEAEMTLHDAAMTRFTQWWNRSRRAGHAFAEGAWLHGDPPERHYARESRRALIWGVLLPIGLTGASLLNKFLLLGFLVYLLQVIRLALRLGSRSILGWQRAGFLVLGRFPEGLGWLAFHFNRLSGRRRTLIEYK